ncbi:hypothetical protein DMC30DRAFT_125288 [Rhodotorula diobovata]|uniref:Uncharacterized protein n=1 Tax=Rhodotorula diobovata TaxID=5288 RepID=A0A5C5FKJ9_9BASI|nr:hypothetical protein DMC30DRAFT_125288 [Rhodotorula diobovata]
MGTPPALEARASPRGPLPTSPLVPAPSTPLHTPTQTPFAHPTLPEYPPQHAYQVPAPPASSRASHTAAPVFISNSSRYSPRRLKSDRRVASAPATYIDSPCDPARRPEVEWDRGASLSRRGSSTGFEKRPRTRERRRVSADGTAGDASLDRRQWQIPQAEGYPSCYYVDLSVFTCYPEQNTTLVQDDYSLAIWNSAQPSFINRGYVDVYLYNADTQDVATSWRNESNAQGMIGIVPDDPWWPSGQTAQEWFGDNARNRSTPYFFVVVPAGDSLTGGEVHGATFTAIQTAAPTSLSSALAALTTSSLSSVSSSSLASLSSLSSLSALSASSLSSASASASGPSGSGTSRSGPGSLQNESSSGGPSIPNYAIALIVVLGFLALLAGAIAVYCCLGRGRRRRRQDEAAAAAAAAAGAGRRGASSGDLTDLGSTEPMLGGGAAAGAASRGSRSSSRAAPPPAGAALLGAGALGGAAAAGGGGGGGGGGTRDPEKDDDNTLSQSDAARMAEAFRAALRKPEYAPAVPPVAGALGGVGAGMGAVVAGPGAGPSPTGGREGTDSSGSGGSSREDGNGVGRGIMEEELRSEGKSMRSVEGGGKRWGRTG